MPLKFDANGLVPVVVQDHVNGEIRMLAYANEEAVRRTIETGLATFWSRSRGVLWVKGETSGNEIRVARVLVDCDGDSLVYVAEPKGSSCHTGAKTCFFRAFGGGQLVLAPVEQTTLGELEQVLESRKSATGKASYTKSLYDGGAGAIAAKITEEAGELGAALAVESDDRVVSEAADLLYHLLVGIVWRGISLRRVLAELARRFGQSGHAEKASR